MKSSGHSLLNARDARRRRAIEVERRGGRHCRPQAIAPNRALFAICVATRARNSIDCATSDRTFSHKEGAGHVWDVDRGRFVHNGRKIAHRERARQGTAIALTCHRLHSRPNPRHAATAMSHGRVRRCCWSMKILRDAPSLAAVARHGDGGRTAADATARSAYGPIRQSRSICGSTICQ